MGCCVTQNYRNDYIVWIKLHLVWVEIEYFFIFPASCEYINLVHRYCNENLLCSPNFWKSSISEVSPSCILTDFSHLYILVPFTLGHQYCLSSVHTQHSQYTSDKAYLSTTCPLPTVNLETCFPHSWLLFSDNLLRFCPLSLHRGGMQGS